MYRLTLFFLYKKKKKKNGPKQTPSRIFFFYSEWEMVFAVHFFLRASWDVLSCMTPHSLLKVLKITLRPFLSIQWGVSVQYYLWNAFYCDLNVNLERGVPSPISSSTDVPEVSKKTYPKGPIQTEIEPGAEVPF